MPSTLCKIGKTPELITLFALVVKTWESGNDLRYTHTKKIYTTTLNVISTYEKAPKSHLHIVVKEGKKDINIFYFKNINLKYLHK